MNFLYSDGDVLSRDKSTIGYRRILEKRRGGYLWENPAFPPGEKNQFLSSNSNDPLFEGGWRRLSETEVLAALEKIGPVRDDPRLWWQKILEERIAQIAVIFREADPMKIDHVDNPRRFQQYNSEAKALEPQLRACTSVQELSQVIHAEMQEWFGDGGKPENYLDIAEKIYRILPGSL